MTLLHGQEIHFFMQTSHQFRTLRWLQKEKKLCFILVPIAPGIEDTKKIRDHYLDLVINRLEKLTHQSIKKEILFCESFCINDFVSEYNSYKGNAYGLANTLFQTAFLRPKLKSKRVKNLYFTGQLTVPGPEFHQQ